MENRVRCAIDLIRCGHWPCFETALNKAGVSIDPVMEIGSREAVWLTVARGIGIGVVSEIEYIPHPDLRTVGISDAEVYTTAHVNCLTERRESRLIGSFFQVCRGLLTPGSAA